jgi:hypothetical protein
LLPDNEALLLLEVSCHVWPISTAEVSSSAINVKEVKVTKSNKSIRIFNKLVKKFEFYKRISNSIFYIMHKIKLEKYNYAHK